MEAADGSTNSKVIVQFTDPSGLFNDVAPLLQNRLPLGNLHWKSPTRPLRSIEELDVSLDREQSPPQDGGATRRHQIPGLRQTPFVRIYLLRCDDKEKYKESARKDVKDWVKSLGFSTSGKSTTKGQERHDAYEYIILHVVLPGTAAASQPKSSKHISVEMADSTDSVNSKSKWTGKSTSTILDKLKADFSSSSKVPFERVAQIRLADPAKPSTTLSPLEIEEQWTNFIEKLKTAILQSFDARVAQYEEDIREREQQRSLPGWNFCTFFILKEGLARGFENVGLLEDALQIYEELDAGLDAVIQDQAKEDYSDAANALLPFASDLKDTIRAVLNQKDTNESDGDHDLALSLQAWTNAESKRFPWRLERRNYQQMILTNQVSALDFRIYIFIRQMQIMLRRAGMSVPPPRSKSANRQSGQRWDASILSEICERSIKFMNLAARNLRQDLFAAWGGREGLPDEELKIQQVVIDNIVASWKWSSLLQTLSECHIISSFSSLSARRSSEGNGELFSPHDVASSHVHMASNSTSTASSGVNRTDSSTKDIFDALRIVKGSKTDLVFWAAELFTMLRNIFLQLCRQTHLLPHLPRIAHSRSPDVDMSTAWTGILAPSLRSVLHTEESALGAYKLLTVCACQCYTTAGKSRASRQLLFDLASLEAHNENHEAAASWLDAVPGFLDGPPRTSTDRSMLRVYMDCLRKAGRHEELVQSLFLDIQSAIHDLSVQKFWTEMIEAASQGPVALPFDVVFAVDSVDNHISHDSSQDFYTLTVVLRILVPVKTMQNATAELKGQSRGQHSPAQLVLTSEVLEPIRESCMQLHLSGRTQTEGWYDAVSLTVTIGNITFKHDFQRTNVADADDRVFDPNCFVPPSIYIYPRNGAPQLQASHAPLVDLPQKRNVSIRLKWPSIDISEAQLRLKPATAGARLDIQSAHCVEGTNFEIKRIDDSHVLVFTNIQAEEETVFEIPYSLDDPSTLSMSIRAEMQYESSGGRCEYYDTLSFMTLLPIGVNVQDVFQKDATFSRFTFAPSRLVPISILDCKLEGTAGCEVNAPSWAEPVDAFPKQPVSWVVQMRTRSQASATDEKLVLTVSYNCVDEMLLDTIVHDFAHQATRSDGAHGSLLASALRPLASHLRNKLHTLWTEQDIELAALTSEVTMWTYEELGWDSILNIFAKHHREPMKKSLQEWHESRIKDPLNMDVDAAPMRTLRLLVDPPRTDMLVTTRIKVDDGVSCIVGQPILAKLCVASDVRANIDAEVTVEITGQTDSWLVGGQRKAAFMASRREFEGVVVLIPQKTGSLLLPGVEVKCRDAKDNGKSVAYEVDNLSSATVVDVRAGVGSTTVGLGDGEASEGYWLLDARRAETG